MMKYTISEKECDPRSPCIDLSTYDGYLLIPEKFVMVEREVPLTVKVNEGQPPQVFTTTKYRIKTVHVIHYSAYSKRYGLDEHLESKTSFFGLIVPSGKIRQVEPFKVDKHKNVYTIYSLQEQKDILPLVTVKNLH